LTELKIFVLIKMPLKFKTTIMKKSLLTFALLITLITMFGQPSGTIIAFAGPKNKIPAGWVACDGKLYDKSNTTYERLFNAIGVSWGGDGVNKFAVPDLRGQFLRGVSENTNVDPDALSRSKSRPDLNSSGNGGNAVGSKESDTLKSHIHKINDPGHAHTIILHPTNGDGGIGWSGYDPGPGKPDHGTERAMTGITKTELNDGKETRPKNAYVYYIIKL
jgi:microcystin-dependent protein